MRKKLVLKKKYKNMLFVILFLSIVALGTVACTYRIEQINEIYYGG